MLFGNISCIEKQLDNNMGRMLQLAAAVLAQRGLCDDNIKHKAIRFKTL